MTYKVVRKLHLYIGLILTIPIIMLSLTGLYLNHQHDWFHAQNIHYLHPTYDSIVEKAVDQEKNNQKRLPEAVQAAVDDKILRLEQIKSVNYASHGLGYFYYVHLSDENESIVVVTESGEIAKVYSDPSIKKWMRALHIGMIDSINFVLMNDVTTLGIIFLTISGLVLE